jgi:hypothetical protein
MNYSAYNSFKRATKNCYGFNFTKNLFKSKNQFAFFNSTNSPKKLINIQNCFFTQNILQMTRLSMINKTNHQSQVCCGFLTQDELDVDSSTISSLAKLENIVLGNMKVLCEGKNFFVN